MAGLIDSGWAAWLPPELVGAMEALDANAAGKRAFAKRLADGPDAETRGRWDRFALVAPSRIDVPASAAGLTPEECWGLVLTLDHDQVRELEGVRMAREVGDPATPVEALPSLDARFGGAKVGRNDPCPCGSGKKFKRCHGS